MGVNGENREAFLLPDDIQLNTMPFPLGGLTGCPDLIHSSFRDHVENTMTDQTMHPPKLDGTEISVPLTRILRHVVRESSQPDVSALRLKIVATEGTPAPIFTHGTYLANIGTDAVNPLLLELRFAPIEMKVDKIAPDWVADPGMDERVRIALLMTNERYWRDLALIGEEFYTRAKARGVEFDAVIAPESLGSKLSQEIARVVWEREGRNIYLTSLQKGKPQRTPDGTLIIGSPKPWVQESSGIPVISGTSHAATQQKLYLDQTIGAKIAERGLRVLLVDDARLTQGTIDAGIQLLRAQNITVAGIATVLNEGNDTQELGGVPFLSLTKLPLFAPVAGGIQPISGTLHGLEYFYVEQEP